MENAAALPRAFIWRRVHSLMGLWLVLFLMEHLLVNSQAALLLGDNARGFVDMVNSIHNLPFLEVIEVFLLGVPILFHLVLGIKYLRTAKSNAKKSDGSKPALPEYKRNKAYSWQRITSWILVFLLLAHIAKFRFIQYPVTVDQGKEESYLVKVNMDDGLYTLANRLGVQLFDKQKITEERESVEEEPPRSQKTVELTGFSETYLNEGLGESLVSLQNIKLKNKLVRALKGFSLKEGQVVASCPEFGTASLLSVRDTFKNPIYVFFYTIFVLSAAFHAFNGLWTFLISWGIVLRVASQKTMGKFAVGLMILVAFLGLMAIWGTYLLNLRN